MRGQRWWVKITQFQTPGNSAAIKVAFFTLKSNCGSDSDGAMISGMLIFTLAVSLGV